MSMAIESCFAALAETRRDEIVITSAGTSSEVWWELTHDTESTFYLEASMSLSTMFAAGLAMRYPEARFWAFLGDGAFVMNTGALFVERQLALPNLVSVIIANRCYGATGAVDLPDSSAIDFAGMAKAAGIRHVHRFGTIDTLKAEFAEAARADGPTTIVLDVALPQRHYGSPPLDGPELKYRFGRALEAKFARVVLP